MERVSFLQVSFIYSTASSPYTKFLNKFKYRVEWNHQCNYDIQTHHFTSSHVNQESRSGIVFIIGFHLHKFLKQIDTINSNKKSTTQQATRPTASDIAIHDIPLLSKCNHGNYRCIGKHPTVNMLPPVLDPHSIGNRRRTAQPRRLYRRALITGSANRTSTSRPHTFVNPSDQT